jgi:CRISPR type IV-associated protein Csf3
MLDSPLPLHLDALVAYAITQERLTSGATGPIERLADDLPLDKEVRGADWVWKASALMADHVLDRGMRLWTRKFDEYDWSGRVMAGHTTQKAPEKRYAQVIDTQRGQNKQFYEHVPIKYVSSLTAYCVGDHDRLLDLLAPESGHIIALGGRTRMGLGTIADDGFEIHRDDFALEAWDRRILPWPHEGGVPSPNAAATRPPYFSPANRCRSYVRPELLG